MNKKQVKTQQMEFNPVIISALRYYNWVVFSHQNFSLGGLGALAGMVVAMVIYYSERSQRGRRPRSNARDYGKAHALLNLVQLTG